MSPELSEHVLETVMYRRLKYHALAIIDTPKKLHHNQCLSCAFDNLMISECQKNIGKSTPHGLRATYCIPHNNPHHKPLYWVEDSKLEETVVNLIVKRMGE